MSIETIGPIVIFVMLLGLVLVVRAGLSSNSKSGTGSVDTSRRSQEKAAVTQG